jgi:hypothetical protein
VAEALEACDRGYLGRGVVLEGSHDTLMADVRERRAYLGVWARTTTHEGDGGP